MEIILHILPYLKILHLNFSVFLSFKIISALFKTADCPQLTDRFLFHKHGNINKLITKLYLGQILNFILTGLWNLVWIIRASDDRFSDNRYSSAGCETWDFCRISLTHPCVTTNNTFLLIFFINLDFRKRNPWIGVIITY